MKFLCDTHIPLFLCDYLLHLGHECTHVNHLNIAKTDDEIALYADQHGCILITKDSSFCDDKVLRGSPRSFILINLLNLQYDEVVEAFNRELERVIA